MLQNTEQTLDKFVIALANRELHRNNKCPANHTVEVDGLEVGIDGDFTNRGDLVDEAQELLDEGFVVLYSSTYNSYVLAPF